jgi:hypothetical protein
LIPVRSIGTTFFKTVPESINTLLLPAVFGANAEDGGHGGFSTVDLK